MIWRFVEMNRNDDALLKEQQFDFQGGWGRLVWPENLLEHI